MDIKRAKRSSWLNFCEAVDSVNELSRFRRVLSKDPVAPGYIQRADNSWTQSSSESLSLLMETHFPGCIDLESNQSTDNFNNLRIGPDTEFSDTINDMISGDKVSWAVNTFGCYKSPGPDGIIPAMLQNVNERVISLIVNIFKECLRQKHVPKGWREVKVIFIPKAGKASHSKPKDFRPISLSSFLLKTLERLIDLFIRSNLDTHTISGAQHAYLKGKSVESALHEVVSYVELGLLHKEYTLAAFLDIEGAFNNITIEAIRESLISLRICDLVVEWIILMLSSRTINSTMGNKSVRKLATRGTPQGGVLSPLLWLLAINSILRLFDAKGRKIVAYADDVVLLVKGKFLPTIGEVIQSELRELSAWAKDKGLGVNPSKTELVLFTKRYKVEPFRLPVLDGIELKLSKEAKYLGVYLDSKLSWKKNTQVRVTKGLNAYYTCRNSICKNWGLKPEVVYWLYTSVVRPILTYGCSVWWKAMNLGTHRNLLSKVQRCASIGITGAVRSTPQAALDTILHLLPIDQFVKGMAARSLFRLKELGLIRNFRYGHSSILEDIVIEGSKLSSLPPTDYIMSVNDFGITPIIEIPDRCNWTGVDVLHKGSAVFTDGSKMDVGTGAGVYLWGTDIKRSFRLLNICSVFQAEILGIIKALDLVQENIAKGSEVTIYVDSQAALLALTGPCVKSKLVLECREGVRKLMDSYSVRLCWVPGHCGVIGNEIADELARGGSALDESLSVASVRAPIGFFFGAIRTWTLNNTTHSWRNREDCRISRAIWPSLNLHDSKFLLSMSRGCLRILIGIITGHFHIGRRADYMNGITTDYCRLCEDAEELETVDHILCHCPVLERKRLRYFGSHTLEGLDEVASIGLKRLVSFTMSVGWIRRGFNAALTSQFPQFLPLPSTT